MLNIDLSRININPTARKRFTGNGKFIEILDYICIKGNFIVPARPIVMEDKLIDVNPYKVVLNRLLQSVDFNNPKNISNNLLEKVFILNEPKFFEKSVQDDIIAFFVQYGYTIINPLDYSLKEQINLFRKARVIAGFCGSSLHNSIFSESLEIIIEIGRKGMTHCNPNQKICADISGAGIFFCEYGKVDEIKSRLFDVIKNI